jgi:hypothetical protein
MNDKMIYKFVNDAALNPHIPDAIIPNRECYCIGSSEIWYMKPFWFRQGINGELPNPEKLEDTHILLGSVCERSPEYIWRMMQGEAWSPFGEAARLITSKGLGHTSMSVGDVIKTKSGTIMIANIGMTKLETY